MAAGMVTLHSSSLSASPSSSQSMYHDCWHGQPPFIITVIINFFVTTRHLSRAAGSAWVHINSPKLSPQSSLPVITVRVLQRKQSSQTQPHHVWHPNRSDWLTGARTHAPSTDHADHAGRADPAGLLLLRLRDITAHAKFQIVQLHGAIQHSKA